MTPIIPAVRVASTEEKAYFRTHGQHSQLYLAFPQPAIVFKALINDPAPNCDMAVWVSYDSAATYGYGGDAYEDIIPDMTLLVGSSEGASDLGIARIRKAASSTKLFVGRTSEVKFADNMFLTVIDEYGLWPRIKYIQQGANHVDYMDFDVAYVPGANGQHAKLDPVPIMGPDRVLFYQGTLGAPSNVITTVFDSTDSYCLGSTIASRTWTAPGSYITGVDYNPTFSVTFDAPGTYRITLTVVATNGKSFTGRRVVVVYDDTYKPVKDFKLNSCNGEYTEGGWNFKITMYDKADLSLVRDRAQVILFSRDWYGDTTTLTNSGISFDAANKKILKSSGLDIFTKGMTIQVSGTLHNNGEYNIVTSNTAYLVVDKVLVDESAGSSFTIKSIHSQKEISIGPIAGCENIICNGWIAKESLNLDIQGGVAAFTAQGPQYWFDNMQGYISGLLYSATAPSEWNYVMGLTVASGLWDLLHWRSTATVMMDCFVCGETQLMPSMENTSIDSMWKEISGQAAKMFAICCCDRYGRFFAEVDGQLIPIGSRAFTNVMTIEAYDRTGEIVLERATVPPVDMVDLSGVWFDGTTGYAIRALASGHLFDRYGNSEIIEEHIMADQASCNVLASLIYAQRNNRYPTMSIVLGSNMRLVDICPQQQLFVVTTTDQNPRKITVSNNIFPRKMSYVLDDKNENISVQIEGEPETTVTTNVVKGDIPVPTQPPTDDWIPPITWSPILPLPIVPPIEPPTPPPAPPNPEACEDAPTGPFDGRWDVALLDGDPYTTGGNIATCWFPCVVRSMTYFNYTHINFTVTDISLSGASHRWLRAYAIDASGARIIESDGLYVESSSGNVYNMVAEFATYPLLNAAVAGFQVELEKGWDDVFLGAIYDDMVPGERRGETWLYPGNASMTLVTDDSAHGYVKATFNGFASLTESRGNIFGFTIEWHSVEGVSGHTWIRASWTQSGGGIMYREWPDNVECLQNVMYDSSSGPHVASKGVYIEFPPYVTAAVAGTLEIFYLGDSSVPRELGLGNPTIYNVCPAV